MRNFLLVTGEYNTSATDYSEVPAGDIGIFTVNKTSGKLTTVEGPTTDEAVIVVGRAAENGGPIVVPFYNKDLTYNFGTYDAPTKFKAQFVFPSSNFYGTYTIIAVKKGKLFNERCKFTIDAYFPVETNYNDIVNALIKQFKAKEEALGLKASFSAGTFTIEAVNAGEDYEILLADKLNGVKVTVVNSGSQGFGTYEHIVDLANKAAADSGFNYTYEEGVTMYPNYPLPADTTNSLATEQFNIFNIRFAEPRKVRTVDTVVHQIIQIALPSGDSIEDKLFEILDAMTGTSVSDEDDTPVEGGEEENSINPADLVE